VAQGKRIGFGAFAVLGALSCLFSLAFCLSHKPQKERKGKMHVPPLRSFCVCAIYFTARGKQTRATTLLMNR